MEMKILERLVIILKIEHTFLQKVLVAYHM